jgi:hypothetical protein
LIAVTEVHLVNAVSCRFATTAVNQSSANHFARASASNFDST